MSIDSYYLIKMNLNHNIDKAYYYEILLRNGYILPSSKSPFVSLEYLLFVKREKVQ